MNSIEFADVVGVGFGPANLAVAVAMREREFGGRCLFLEQAPDFAWQPSMILAGSDIQHHPLRDLITPINPRSPFGFVSYLHSSGRFFEYLNLGSVFPLREEFGLYAKWVADRFGDVVRYATKVTRISIADDPAHGKVIEVTAQDGRRWRARAAVVAPGRSRNIPAVFSPSMGPRVFHLCDYLPRIADIGNPTRIAVVGASQSAVEIMLDLDARFPEASIVGLIRGFGYRLKDTSPFTGEVFFPEFTDYFYAADQGSRRSLSNELRTTNYGSADGDVLNRLYLRRYESRIRGNADHLRVLNNSAVIACASGGNEIHLTLVNKHTGLRSELSADAVVLATGFLDHGTGGARELVHPMLAEISRCYEMDPVHGLVVGRDYSLIGAGMPPCYVNGLNENTHGFGDAGSFSLLSIRAATIVDSILMRLRSSTPTGCVANVAPALAT